MGAKKSLWLLITLTLALIIINSGFNLWVDPFCYYCADVDPKKYSLNRYYQVAQLIHTAPETEQVILGSSRGETTSAPWLEEITGLKTLNLSKAGSEIIAKKAFLAIAAEKMKLKRVIWIADYFEFIQSTADPILMNTPSLVQYAGGVRPVNSLKLQLEKIQKLFDHNTTEASVASMKRSKSFQLGRGEGSQIDFKDCGKSDFAGNLSAETLKQEVDLLYQFYVHGPIRGEQSMTAIDNFNRLAQEITAKNIELIILIPPYHPTFMKKLKTEYPQIYESHLQWIQRLESLKSPLTQVVSFFPGIPGDNGSPSYWNDGVHFNCKSAQKMLKTAFGPNSN